MQGQRGFRDIDERLKDLSAEGDRLEKLNATVDFEIVRADLRKALHRSHPSTGGRPGAQVQDAGKRSSNRICYRAD